MKEAKQDWTQGKHARAVFGFIDRHGYIVTGLICLGILGAVIFNTRDTASTNRATLDTLETNLIHSCQVAGDPVRRALVGIVQDQLRERNSLDYTEFFPNVPPGTLRQLLEQQEQQDRTTLRVLTSIPTCKERFEE